MHDTSARPGTEVATTAKEAAASIPSPPSPANGFAHTISLWPTRPAKTMAENGNNWRAPERAADGGVKRWPQRDLITVSVANRALAATR